MIPGHKVPGRDRLHKAGGGGVMRYVNESVNVTCLNEPDIDVQDLLNIEVVNKTTNISTVAAYRPQKQCEKKMILLYGKI